MTRSRGFTIIEFMIAMTLSLLVLAALTAAFVASSRSRAEIERANEQMESGRFALQILTDDLEMAGFYSHLDLDIALNVEFPMVRPTAKINPCVTAVSAVGVNNDLIDALPMHIQGYDSPAVMGADLDDCLLRNPPGIDDLQPGSDIIVVRRTATCVGGAANCAVTVGAPYFQASLCSTDLNDTAAVNYFELEPAADAGLTNLGRTQRDCATPANGRQYLTHIYFITRNDSDGDGIPTLRRAELGNALDPDGFTVVPLARGIQDLQFEYGIDDVGNDGAPDAFVSNPDAYDGANCAGTAGEKAKCVANWRNVMVVRISLLARNTIPTPDHVDTKEYSLGLNDDGSRRCARDDNDDGVCEAFGDGFKRHVYQTSVRLNNPAGRREQ